MKSKVIGILESRTGEHLAGLIARRGAVPLLAPALEELPDVDPQGVAALLADWPQVPFDVVIFQTGVGTRALFQVTDQLGVTANLLTLLAAAYIVVRGPKPTGELNSRGVRMDLKALSPFTTETVLEALQARPLAGQRVLVQRYGAANQPLKAALESRGATVEEIKTYRWALPADLAPLERLLSAVAAKQVDALMFTSAVQVHNLFEVARRRGQDGVLASQANALFVASIGPVCSRALREFGIEPRIEADPPKLGPLLSALEAALTN